MRVVTLSDHAADQIQKAQDLRTAVNDRMRADWQAAIDRREADIADHAGALRQAWAKRRVIAVIVIFFNWLGARLSRQPVMPCGPACGCRNRGALLTCARCPSPDRHRWC